MITQEPTEKTWIARNKKLTPEQILEVTNRTDTIENLALKFGVSPSCISKVRQRTGTVKARAPKVEKPAKLPPKKKKTINKAETKFEAENKERAKALKLAEDFKSTTEDKLASGEYIWVDVFPRGKALRKVN